MSQEGDDGAAGGESQPAPETKPLLSPKFDAKKKWKQAGFAIKQMVKVKRVLYDDVSEQWKENSFFLWAYRHPWSRIFMICFMPWLNFLVLAEDPTADCYQWQRLPVVGRGIVFLTQYWPPDALWCVIKFILGFFGILVGMVFGHQVLHHMVLRDALGIKMFHDCNGTFLIMLITTIISLAITANFWNHLLRYSPHADDLTLQITDLLGMRQDIFNKLAGSATWLGDAVTLCMVSDAILQDKSKYPEWLPGARKAWPDIRQFVTPTILIVFSVPAFYFVWCGREVWREFPLRHALNLDLGQFGRNVLGGLIFMGDVFIVAQDWDFPEFDCPVDVKVCGMPFEKIEIKSLDIHISGKWMNFGIMFVVMLLDAVQCLGLTTYEPTFNGQYVDPVTKEIWSINSIRQVDQLAMASSLWEKNEDKIALLLRQDDMNVHLNPLKGKGIKKTFPGFLNAFQLSYEGEPDVWNQTLKHVNSAKEHDVEALSKNIESPLVDPADYEPPLWRVRKPFRHVDLGVKARLEGNGTYDFPLRTYYTPSLVGTYVAYCLLMGTTTFFCCLYHWDSKMEVERVVEDDPLEGAGAA